MKISRHLLGLALLAALTGCGDDARQQKVKSEQVEEKLQIEVVTKKPEPKRKAEIKFYSSAGVYGSPCYFEFGFKENWREIAKAHIKGFDVDNPSLENLREHANWFHEERKNSVTLAHSFILPKHDPLFKRFEGSYFYRFNLQSLEEIQLKIRVVVYYSKYDDPDIKGEPLSWEIRSTGRVETDCPGGNYDFIIQTPTPIQWKTLPISQPIKEKLNRALAGESKRFQAEMGNSSLEDCTATVGEGLLAEASPIQKKWAVVGPEYEFEDCVDGQEWIYIYDLEDMSRVGKAHAYDT